MGSTNKTTNIELSQFVGTDKPAWLTDYNSDMEKIDAAVAICNTVIDSIKSDLDTADTGLKDRVTAAESEILTAQSDISSLDGTVGSHTTELSTLDARVDSLESTTEMQSDAITGATQLAYTIGNVYDSTNTYDVGDYAIFNNTLYKCITAVPTGEVFDPVKWQSVKVMSEIPSTDSEWEQYTTTATVTDKTGTFSTASHTINYAYIYVNRKSKLIVPVLNVTFSGMSTSNTQGSTTIRVNNNTSLSLIYTGTQGGIPTSATGDFRYTEGYNSTALKFDFKIFNKASVTNDFMQFVISAIHLLQ